MDPVLASAENLVAWTAALNRLDAGLLAAGSLLTGPAPSAADHAPQPLALWETPTLSGSLPAELAERAAALLAAQRVLIGHLQQASVEAKRQLQAVAAIPAPLKTGGAVYLDVNG